MQNNKMRTCLCILCVAAAALLSSCSKTPKGVIPEKDMAVLLADMAEGDAVVELNRSDYGSDESRKALKQSILIKNGYTQADFDKSLMWYGHNLDVYGDVYDDVVSILEDRQRDARNEAKKVGERLVAAGDSVDVWQQSHSLLSTGVSAAVWCSWLSLIPPTARCAQATATNGGCRWSTRKTPQRCL